MWPYYSVSMGNIIYMVATSYISVLWYTPIFPSFPLLNYGAIIIKNKMEPLQFLVAQYLEMSWYWFDVSVRVLYASTTSWD